MNINFLKIFGILTLVIAFTSCKKSNEYTPVNETTAEQKHNQTHKVTVKKIEDAGMYSYVQVQENDEEYWIAITKSNIEVGQTYYYDGGSKMLNFESKELNKTFKEVTFVDALRGHEKKAPKVADTIEKIEQPEEGTAIEAILSNPETFKDKEIVVKGKVVKVNKNIMDRNWVHLRDGTRFEDISNLTFTTNDSTIKVGDIVTLKGTVTLNKDFGHGYLYPILVEKGELVK